MFIPKEVITFVAGFILGAIAIIVLAYITRKGKKEN